MRDDFIVKGKRINHAIAEVKATLAVDGLIMNKQEETIYRKYLNGEFTEKEALKRIALILNLK